MYKAEPWTVLVNAWLGVRDLVKAGHFKSVGIPPLPFVHVVPQGQDHLQELPQSPALHHLPGSQTQSWDRRDEEAVSYTVYVHAQNL